ncbi:hypothetical protein QC764_512575 [Podospora pseudoanserina]|uniref:Heterokaryon incompatibility domain-containing protein n=1 Tax=Podospora pseudoanserina TaxID=2609844 RepID=A0ABR0I522_9PEZI|nr:hypothetical protein QC764_512575 [Podospora pseudoanserina]
MYQTLRGEEFRVAQLLPAEFDDEIRCVLEIRPPDIKTAYEALSYQWGDDSNLKTIHILHLRRPPNPPDNRLARARLRKGLSMVITRLYIIFAWYHIRSIEFRLNLQLAMMVLNLHFGGTIPDVVDEMLDTKPWRLAYSFRATDVEDFDFDDLQVTPSLDLALRHLRSGTASRTLWIDALCINRKGEAEKLIQIQCMQAIYANAWQVVVRLGGYHGITAENSACSEADYCLQRHQIEKAFYAASALSTPGYLTWTGYSPNKLLPV